MYEQTTAPAMPEIEYPAPARPDTRPLRARVIPVLTATLAAMLMVGAASWLTTTRQAIHEEVEAATRVAEQWLMVLIPETLDDGPDGMERLMSHLAALGRLRANRLEVHGSDGAVLYASPDPTYKAGRDAPAWFAHRASPVVTTRSFEAGDRRIVLRPDTSRAVLDAWDELLAGLGWAITLLTFIWIGMRVALERALAPLTQIDAALARGAEGHFDMRLPLYGVAELDRLAASYNRLADSLEDTRSTNHRLELDQAVALAIQARLEDERRFVARELHDELGQGITAVRALAGAVLQRTSEQPQLHGSAQAILAMTTQMQDGVRTILQRLRIPGGDNAVPLDDVMRNYCALWSRCHPGIALTIHEATGKPRITSEIAETVLRLLQESLTNVARHADAQRAEVRLVIQDDYLELEVCDDGRGLPLGFRSSRFGITGMHERVAHHRGQLQIAPGASGGLTVRARLPLRPVNKVRTHDVTA